MATINNTANRIGTVQFLFHSGHETPVYAPDPVQFEELARLYTESPRPEVMFELEVMEMEPTLNPVVSLVIDVRELALIRKGWTEVRDAANEDYYADEDWR